MSLRTKVSAAVAAGTILGAAIIGTVGQNEGRSLTAYWDSAGVLTICDGDTTNVRPGQRATVAECDARLRAGIQKHAAALDGLPEGLPDAVVLGAMDLTYNIGVGGFNSSSVKQCLARRDYKCAKAATLKWKYITVNGRKYDCSTPGNTRCSGLWKRRLWESRAVGNEFKTLEEAVRALPR